MTLLPGAGQPLGLLSLPLPLWNLLPRNELGLKQLGYSIPSLLDLRQSFQLMSRGWWKEGALASLLHSAGTWS